jgi:restriction system protein
MRLKHPELALNVFKRNLNKKRRLKTPQETIQLNLDKIHHEHEISFKKKLLQMLRELTPDSFEHFAGRLLEAYGFKEVKITQKSKDGGIDGHGKLKVGLAYINVAFQCKRWQGKVGRPEIDKFRGACQGRFEQGLFFTTSDFSPESLDASFQAGAIPIILIHGEAIVDLMVEKGFGVEKIPLFRYEVKDEDFNCEK